MSDYVPEKWIWTDADFGQMSWHASHTYAFGLEGGTLVFDIDYIFQWYGPPSGESGYRFWTSPATLVFDGVTDFRFNLTSHDMPSIMKLTRSEPSVVPDQAPTWLWTMECLEGEIEFRATGYRQFTRCRPVYTFKEWLSSSQRREISFAQVTPA